MKTELQQNTKETLEEASIRAVKSGLFKDETLFIAGAKWQQKRMYSEEDMLNFAWFLKENLGQFSCDRTAHFEGKYIEQFKKK